VPNGGYRNRLRVVVHLVDNAVITHTKATALPTPQRQAVAPTRFLGQLVTMARPMSAAFSGETRLLKNLSAGRSTTIR
jgi:hypothetical protein